MNDTLFNQIELKLEKGHPIKALDDIKLLCNKNGLTEYYHDTINFKGQAARLESTYQKGTVTREEHKVELSRFAERVRWLLERVKEDLDEVEFTETTFLKVKAIGRRKEKNYTQKLKNIAWLESGIDCASSVCLIKVKKRNEFHKTYEETGSGFLFKTEEGLLLLTNNHVISSEDDLKDTTVIFNYQQNIEGNMKKQFEYLPDLDYFATNSELDYTVFSVKEEGPHSLEYWKPLKLVSKNQKRFIRTGEHVTIIQHPLGNPKKIALNENRITEVKDNSVFYLTDTEKGSSGSPVFNDQWEVIALHWGADIFTANDGSTHWNNGGTLIEKIKEDLADKGIDMV